MGTILPILQDVAMSIANVSTQGNIVNLKKILRLKFQENGFSDLDAFEKTEIWLKELTDLLENELSQWDYLGLPRPLLPASSPATFLTHRHHKYIEQMGVNGLPEDFIETYQFIGSLSPRQFLVVPSCLLHIIGCNPILVTDGSGDDGIDCMGQIPYNPIRSLCIFVQAKTSINQISKDLLRKEYAKYRELLGTARFSESLAAVGKSYSEDGRSTCYMVVANNEFDKLAREYSLHPAREFALHENILLRSKRQSAYWLSQYFGYTNLKNLVQEIGSTLYRDLNRNLAPTIAKYRKDN